MVRIFPNMHFDTMKNSKLEVLSEKQIVQAIEKLNATQKQRVREVVTRFLEENEKVIALKNKIGKK